MAMGEMATVFPLPACLPYFPLTLSEAALLQTFPNADTARAAEYGHAPVQSESKERKRGGNGKTREKEKKRHTQVAEKRD